MKFDGELSWRAEQDLEGILTWLYERSPQGAATWHQAWKDTVAILAESARTYGLAPENEGQEFEIRQITFHTPRGRIHRALFIIRGRDVLVMHIRGPGQDLVRPDEIAWPT